MTRPKRKNMMLLAQPVPHRLCWECAHVAYHRAEHGSSEFTPGIDMELYCGKGYWIFDQYDETLGNLRDRLRLAERCGDFAQGKLI